MNESPDPLEDVFARYVDQLNAGKGLDLERVRAENPDIAARLLEELQAYELLGGEPEAEVPLGSVGDYTLRRQIGRGGMGVVYEAWQESVDRVVALKVLPPGVAADNNAFHRFMREAKTAGQLNHRNVVAVYSTGVEEGTPWYSMEYVEGETLERVLARTAHAEPESETPFGEKDSLAYFSNLAGAFADVADGLQHAHSRGVVHRDLKPSNLILDGDGRLRILDFGLARLEGQQSLTLSGEVVGTPLYMSPEQARRKKIPVDHRTDVYSLGATLYEALCGRPPFRGKSHADTLSQIVERDPTEPRKTNPRVPKDLETIVLKCLRKDPGDRYGTAEALRQDLKRFVRGDLVEARPPGKWSKWTRWAARNRRPATLTALVALVLAVSGIAYEFHRESVEKTTGVLGREGASIRDPLSWLKDSLQTVGPEAAAGRLWELLEQGEQDRGLWTIWLALTLDDLGRAPRDLLEQVRSLASVDGHEGSWRPGRDDAEWLLRNLSDGQVLRIDCGRREDAEYDGDLWSRDRFFFRGGMVSGKKIDIEGTNKPALYRLQHVFDRLGGYAIPVPPGKYTVRLHFARTFQPEPGARVFDVYVDGRLVLAKHDTLSGGFGKAYVREFPVNVDDGVLDIVFKKVSGFSVVAGIEIEAVE